MQLGKDFAKAIKQIEAEKGLGLDIVGPSLEAALISAYKKYKTGNQALEVVINFDMGEISLYEVREVVDGAEDVSDEQISLDDVRRLGFDDVAAGEIIRIEVNPENFGRIAAQTARQVIIQRLKDAERQVIFLEFADRIGEMVQGSVFKTEGDQVLVRLNERTEAILPKEERIVGEIYNPGDKKKFYLLDVRQTTRGPRIVVSRTHPGLLKKLLELEVPEVKEKVIEIHNIVREAGSRGKISIKTTDMNVDPVGACVGNKGVRIRNVMDELAGERIDIIVFSTDPVQYIKNALSPAKILKIEPVLEHEKAYRVYVRSDQLSLSIGKAGQNVRLAARLTGCKIDIKVVEPEKLPTLKDLFEDIIAAEDITWTEELPEQKKKKAKKAKK